MDIVAQITTRDAEKAWFRYSFNALAIPLRCE